MTLCRYMRQDSEWATLISYSCYTLTCFANLQPFPSCSIFSFWLWFLYWRRKLGGFGGKWPQTENFKKPLHGCHFLGSDRVFGAIVLENQFMGLGWTRGEDTKKQKFEKSEDALAVGPICHHHLESLPHQNQIWQVWWTWERIHPRQILSQAVYNMWHWVKVSCFRTTTTNAINTLSSAGLPVMYCWHSSVSYSDKESGRSLSNIEQNDKQYSSYKSNKTPASF